MSKSMMKGNVAIAEAALRAGLQFYAGYPITPQTEVMEYLSGRIPQLQGRTFIQSESELSAINMVYGASAVGFRAMTSSSGPGMSLKQEGISYMTRMELPCVILNVTRWQSEHRSDRLFERHPRWRTGRLSDHCTCA